MTGVPIQIKSSAIGLKICATGAGIEKYNSNKKEKEEYDKMVLLAKSKSNSIEVLVSKALIDSNISHGDYFNK